MAEVNKELDDLAARLFVERTADGRSGAAVAAKCYADADAFLTVRAKVRAGELTAKPADGVQLADCCAPNLPATHPLNLVSQRLGDPAKASRIKKWLDANPTPEKDTEELVSRFHKAFPECNWHRPTHGETLGVFNVARAILPAYCPN